MTTIRKIGFFVILAALFLPPFYAEAFPEGFSFSVSPLIGALYGHSEEIVYKYSDQDAYESELLWDLKPLVYAGVAADFGPANPFQKHGFISEISLKIGLPLKTGIMEDRDWIGSDYLTNYSRHDTYMKHAILSDVSAGYSWRLTSYLALKARAEFSYMRFSWSGENGYAQYASSGSWNSDLPVINLTGKVIEYTQNWFIFSPGFSIMWNPGSIITLEGYFSYSPLIYCASIDKHFLANKTFYDYLYYGHFFNGGGQVIYTLRPNIDLAFSFSYKRIIGSRGDNVTVTEYGGVSVSDDYNGIAGGGYSAIDIGIFLKLNLF